MKSEAATVEAYLAELPIDRREAIEAVRAVILKNLKPGYVEGMQYGMIGYFVPHSVYPHGYHCDPKQPLPYAALASQKNYMSVYLMTVYGEHEEWFRKEWTKSGKKLDMGKCCVRFKKLDDLALDVIAKAVARVSVRQLIAVQESVDKRFNKDLASRKPATQKATKSKASPAKSVSAKAPRAKGASRASKRA